MALLVSILSWKKPGGKVRRDRIHIAWRWGWSFHSQWWFGMPSRCYGFLKSTVYSAIHREILKHFMLPSADKLYENCDLFFQQDVALAHTTRGTKSWYNVHGVTALVWPRIFGELSTGRWINPTMQPGLPLLHAKTTGLSPPCHSALVHWLMQKELQPNIEYIKLKMPDKAWHLCFKYPFLLIFYFAEKSILGFSLSVRYIYQNYKKKGLKYFNFVCNESFNIQTWNEWQLFPQEMYLTSHQENTYGVNSLMMGDFIYDGEIKCMTSP